jgi:hypothetical protein
MTNSNLKINYEMVLPPQLESAKYSTETVTNLISLQTLEKAFVRYPATSGDDSQITFNLPSINGSAMVRELELEVPIDFTITFTGIAPQGPTLASTATGIPVNGTVATFTYGSSPRPFLNELCCLDTFPLSKIFNNRSYTINNSSTIVKEDFTAEQIDIMSAQLDLEKCENAGMCLFADANTHFRTLDAETGGNMLPLEWTDNVSTYNTVDLWLDALSGLAPALSIRAPSYVLNPVCRYAAGVCDSWQAKRNSARNIVSSSVLFGGVTSGTNVYGFGSNLVPNSNTSPNLINMAYYGNDMVCTFRYVVREQILSQFWDHQDSFNKFSWNKLLPVSSLNIKLDINSKYMREALLKIGDNVSEILANGGTYTVSVPTVGDYSNCYLYARQMKIPLALLPRESYKILYYEQTKPQASKPVKYNGAGSFEAEMTYANLSQVPEYYFSICL